MPSLRIAVVLAASMVAVPLAAQHEGHGAPALGQVTFPNSANEKAQEPFLRGVALLHSYEYGDAADAFRAAQKADPRFALAYWMEALTYSHVDWRTEDVAASRKTLEKFGATTAQRLAQAPVGRE